MLYGVVGSYDATYDIITTTGTPNQLPSTNPGIPAGVKVYDRESAGFSASDTFYAIRSVAVYDDSGSHATHGQVDWVVLPTAAANPIRVVTVYHSTLSDGEAVDPQGANRYFDGTLNTSADIWIEALDTIGNSDVRCQLPADGKFLGLLSGTWDPDPEGSSDERPLYKIQPQHPGVVLGLVTASGTAADWDDTSDPTPGSCTVTLYNYTEAGALEIYKTGVTVAYMAEASPDAGSIVYCGMFEGYWHVITQLCAVASGYSE